MFLRCLSAFLTYLMLAQPFLKLSPTGLTGGRAGMLIIEHIQQYPNGQCPHQGTTPNWTLINIHHYLMSNVQTSLLSTSLPAWHGEHDRPQPLHTSVSSHTWIAVHPGEVTNRMLGAYLCASDLKSCLIVMPCRLVIPQAVYTPRHTLLLSLSLSNTNTK